MKKKKNKNVRAWLVALVLAGASTRSEAGTIIYDGLGQLDARLTSYDLSGNVLHEFQLGTDFMPGLPVGLIGSGDSYFACSGGPNGCDWIGFAFPIMPSFVSGTFPPSTEVTYGDPSQQTALSDGCTQYRSIFFEQEFALVQRGGCSFTDKMVIAEHALFSAVLVDTGATLTTPGLLPGTPAGMPLFAITHAVAGELRVPLIPGPNYLVGLTMSVSWTPVTVPEPTGLPLLGIGLGALGLVRRKRRPT